MFGIKTANSAVAFVSFGHKKFTSRVPMRVLSEDRDFGANIMRRVQSAFAQDMRHHGRGSGFTVHAADDDAAFSLHDGGERFRAPRRSRFRLARANENWIVGPDRRGVDDQLGIGRVLRAMLLEKLQTESPQTFHFHRNRFVRSADLMSELEQERGDAAHPAAGHADQMNAMMFAREKSRQTELHARGRHTAVFVYFSIVSTTALAAFLVESLAAFCDMRCRRP